MTGVNNFKAVTEEPKGMKFTVVTNRILITIIVATEMPLFRKSGKSSILNTLISPRM